MSFYPVPSTPSVFMSTLSLEDQPNSALVTLSRKIDATARPHVASPQPATRAIFKPLSPVSLILPPSRSDQEFVMHQPSFHLPPNDESNVSHVYSRSLPELSESVDPLSENSSPTKVRLSVMKTGEKVRSWTFGPKDPNVENSSPQQEPARKRARSLFDALKPPE